VELRIDAALAASFLTSDNAQAGNPMRILIVDDQPKVRAMLRTLLADTDIEFDEAVNGKDAVAHYADGHWDLVLMDVRMPVMDGIAATEKILSSDRHAHVVAVTDYDDDDCRREALGAGCRRLFGKRDLMSLRIYVKELLRSGHSGSMN
jgi:CheY-like chemotaxis protein